MQLVALVLNSPTLPLEAGMILTLTLTLTLTLGFEPTYPAVGGRNVVAFQEGERDIRE